MQYNIFCFLLFKLWQTVVSSAHSLFPFTIIFYEKKTEYGSHLLTAITKSQAPQMGQAYEECYRIKHVCLHRILPLPWTVVWKQISIVVTQINRSWIHFWRTPTIVKSDCHWNNFFYSINPVNSFSKIL